MSAVIVVFLKGRAHLDTCTVVTDAAMRASWLTVELASLTPFHLDLHAIDIDDLVERLTEVIFFISLLSREPPKNRNETKKTYLTQSLEFSPAGISVGLVSLQ